MWTVYAILDTGSFAYKYIGVTSSSLGIRLGEHVRRARRDKGKRRLNAWLNNPRARPIIVPLSWSENRLDAEADEKAYIANIPDLLNTVYGHQANANLETLRVRRRRAAEQWWKPLQ